MKQSILLCLLALLPVVRLNAQEHQAFQVSVSTVTRVNPILLGTRTPSGRTDPISVSVSDQLNGPGMNISAGYLMRDAHILIAAGNTVRYDIVGYYRVYSEPKPDAVPLWMPMWELISDLEFTVTKYFPMPQTEPFITVGGVLMNRNCSYMVPDSTIKQPMGGYQYTYTKGDFRFPALKTGIGMRYRNWLAELNVLWCFQQVYDFEQRLALPEIRIGYAITR